MKDDVMRERTAGDLRKTVQREIEPRPRPGRRFEPTVERELEGDIRALASRLPNAKHGVLLAPEFVGPNGIVDLLAVTGFEEGLGRRLKSGVPFVTNGSDCAVVAALAVRRPRGPAEVATTTGSTEAQVKRRLASLAGSGAVLRRGNGYVKHPDLEPIGRTYAIEAKVADWRRALQQAVRYGTWADASAVSLLNPPRDASNAEDRFRAFGIGLAVRQTWLVRPRLGHPDRGLRLAASEALARAI